MKTERIGRDGYIGLAFEWYGGRTVLTERRCRAPLQVLEPNELPGGALGVTLLNNGGGMVGGDCATVEIRLGAGARTVVTTASAARVYRAQTEPARHLTIIKVAEDATIDYAPDHLIPHPGAALEQAVELELSPASRAIVVSAMASGRVGRGERFAFRKIDDLVRVTRGGAPVYHSRTYLVPSEIDPARPGIMEGFDYVAGLVVTGGLSTPWNMIAQRLGSRLEHESVNGGVSAIAAGGCFARILAPGAEEMRRAIAGLWAEARSAIYGESSLISLRK